MTGAELAARWRTTRFELFKWRYELGLARKLALCLGMACVTGLAAQIRIPLAFTPVPITGQVFAVLLSGVVLGQHFGALSQIVYVGIGSAGLPWFAGGGGGLPFGPSGGYLLGFVPAAALVGHLTDTRIWLRGIWGQTLLMMAAVAIIYVCGAIQFALVMRTGLHATFQLAVLPFIPVDLAKALAVAGLAATVTPKRSYAEEVDKDACPNND